MDSEAAELDPAQAPSAAATTPGAAEHLSDVVESVPSGIYAIGPDWRCTVVNTAAAEHFGRSRADLLAAVMWEALPQIGGTPIERNLRRAMEDRTTVVFETPSAVRPGRVVEIHVSPTADGGLACIFNDITARKTAEEALEESQSFLWLVLNSASNGFYSVNRDGVTTMINRAGLRMLGFAKAEDAVGRKLHDVIHHSHPDGSPYPKETCPIYRCAAEGTPAHIADELFFPVEGPPLPVEYWAEPIVSDGELRGAICIFADNRERKRAQEIEQRLKEELEALVAARTAERDRMWQLSSDAMIVSDTEGRLLATNPALTALLGWQPEELVGRPGLELVHPEDLEGTTAARDRATGGERLHNYECRLRCKDGQYRALSFSAVPHDGRIYAVGRDVTAEREAAEALRRTEEALRQAQKMEAIGQLTGGIAHDFNNMLAIIIGCLDIADRRLERGDSGVERYLDDARQGAERAAALTQRLLAFSRQQPLAPQLLNVNKLVAEMSDLMRRSLGERVELETVLAAGIWVARVDPHQLEAALLNIAVNARDAMPDGGRLTIETANCYLDDDYVAKEVGVRPGQYLMIALTDSGSGIPAEMLPKVFDPFFTTKPTGKGTGLGLSMVYGFVKQSGGHVRIYSEAGRGTTVKIYLPRHVGAAQDLYERERGVSETPPSASGEVVLVVEDDDFVRHMSVEALRELGYTVFEAASGPEAIRLAANLSRIDLLFTDVVMAGMTGRQLAEALLAERPELRVLYTTGYTRNAVVHNGVLDANVAFLSKPFSVSELARRVRVVLDQKRRAGR